jgi:hypothetical protein
MSGQVPFDSSGQETSHQSGAANGEEKEMSQEGEESATV